MSQRIKHDDHKAVRQLDKFMETDKGKKMAHGVYVTVEQVAKLIAEVFYHGFGAGERNKPNNYKRYD